jgi:pimeloyl-ACP methyl ester carboxylesterase
MAKRRVKWGFAVAALLAIGVIAFGRLGDRLILGPTTAPIDPSGATRTLLPWTGGDVEVFRASSSEREPELFVLRFYGNTDRAERWVTSEAKAWPHLPLEFWAVNYPGYGRSTGPARLSRVADAALIAYDGLRAHAGERPIFVFGTSLGTTAALHVAAEREVAGLVLTNPPALPELIVGEHGWWNLWLVAYPVSKQIPNALDSIANARRVRAPAVFVLSDQDEVVPHKYHRLVADAFAGQKEIFLQQGAGHNTPLPPAFAAKVHHATGRLFGTVVTPGAGASR